MRNNQRKPFIIPVFLPHAACPHQCAFCNQSIITRQKPGPFSLEKIDETIRKFLPYKGQRRGKVQIAFFGGNFLGLENERILPVLKTASRFVWSGEVNSLRLSTRPDTISPESLKRISPFPVETIELGVQSMDDPVLAASRRGHTAADTLTAVRYLKNAKYEIGLQMMVGLPGDTHEKATATARRMIQLSPDFVRIYPTGVFKGTPLAKWYREGRYAPLPLDRCVTLVKELYLLFKANRINVVRMGLQSEEAFQSESAILAGPYHPAFGHLVHSEIFRDMAVSVIESEKKNCRAIRLRVHPQNISKMRGLKNDNMNFLKKKFHIETLKIMAESSLGLDKLTVEYLS